MRRSRAVGVVSLALALGALALVGVALAADQVKGATYKGALTPTRDGVAISFKVSRSGSEVTSLATTNVPFYCQGGGPPVPAHFKNAAISTKGTFTSTAEVRIEIGPLKGQIGEKLRITGKFLKGRKERGVLTTTYPKAHECSGSSSYATKA